MSAMLAFIFAIVFLIVGVLCFITASKWKKDEPLSGAYYRLLMSARSRNMTYYWAYVSVLAILILVFQTILWAATFLFAAYAYARLVRIVQAGRTTVAAASNN